MSELSHDQAERRAAIQKSAMITGGIVGTIAGLLAVWLLGGQVGVVRFGGSIAAALVVGYLVFRGAFSSGAKSAKCASCSAAFSRSRSDHTETLAASTNKEEREEQPDNSVKVTTWVEDAFDVVDTYTCAKCGDVTKNAYKTTRRRDETSVIEAATTAARGKKSAVSPEAEPEPSAARTANKRSRRSN